VEPNERQLSVRDAVQARAAAIDPQTTIRRHKSAERKESSACMVGGGGVFGFLLKQ
jgi:hypothetical protein